MEMRVTKLEKEHLLEAAGLAAENFRALRLAHPLLPRRYEDPDQILGMLEEMSETGSGAAALEGGRLVGFMRSVTIADFMGKRAAYCPEWAIAAEPGFEPMDRRRIYEELYSKISADWSAAELGLHAVSLMGSDQPAREAFHWLGFGIAAVDALREAAPVEALEASFQIRQAEPGDKTVVDELLAGLEEHMSAPPIFWKHEPKNVEDLLSGEGGSLWLAFDRDQAVGLSGLMRGYEEGCAILQDENTIELEPAFVKAGWRGKGVGKALLNRCLEQAQEEGFWRVGVDFESANVGAVRFWTRWFEPVCYSLVRWVDERV